MLPDGTLGQGQLIRRGRFLVGGGLKDSLLRFYVLVPWQYHFVNTVDHNRVHLLTLQQVSSSWVS